MDDKPRLNPFSISNILASKSSRDNEDREVTTTSENERDKSIIEVDDKSSVGGQHTSYTALQHDAKTPGDLYDWEDESTEHSPEKTDFDSKYKYFVV